MRYLRTEKLRSFHLRPFIVLAIAKRAHYKAEKEITCSVNVLKLVSPNQPDLQQLWGQSTSKPNALSLRERTPQVGHFCAPRHRSSLPESLPGPSRKTVAGLGLGLGVGRGWHTARDVRRVARRPRPGSRRGVFTLGLGLGLGYIII